ncbi:enoyl-CoA hydratase/isomerase family protein [Oleisolibacter albus]|uniref:enoyl-CoA hydratase/isomerase family protein n=1 Tax=Oleisolibacter albus TaxID=2171757 RepID=UPI000DF2E701|nr:enoyl-CoA hydratase/isomerase family protein [Oleisolibacter albus]
MSESVRISTDARGVACVTLNRPTVHNAFNDAVIARLTEIFRDLGADRSVRLVQLRGAGASFSAGADLSWMQRMAGFGREENREDALALATMLRTLNEMPKPTLAVVQGPALAGGCGLVAACDIAIAAETALFGLTEVRLGLIPATIGPYVAAAIGPRACRRYFLTGERFDAAEAHRLGLVQALVPPDRLEQTAAVLTDSLLAGGPRAQAAAKALIAAIAFRPMDDALVADTAERIADARASAEGREGIASFLERRRPSWQL